MRHRLPDQMHTSSGYSRRLGSEILRGLLILQFINIFYRCLSVFSENNIDSFEFLGKEEGRRLSKITDPRTAPLLVNGLLARAEPQGPRIHAHPPAGQDVEPSIDPKRPGNKLDCHLVISSQTTRLADVGDLLSL
jgi:hypothetical protein